MEPRFLYFAAVLSLAGPGCGYSFGVIRHEGVKSVAIPIFTYRGLEQRRGIEFELTEAVAEEFISRSGLERLGPEEADAVLEGEIVSFRERVLVEDRKNSVLESSVRVTLNLRLLRQDGEVLLEREGMLEQATFSVVGGEDEIQARRKAFNDMAERIVFAMEGDW